VQLSNQAISALINGKPNALRLQTIQALCNALHYKLSDFCEVLPDTAKEQQKQRKVAGGTPVRLYGAKEPSKNQENIFPDPHQYTETKKGQQGKDKRVRRLCIDQAPCQRDTTSTWPAAPRGRSTSATPGMSGDALPHTRQGTTPFLVMVRSSLIWRIQPISSSLSDLLNVFPSVVINRYA
jgi:hypothetical protein